jgi:hypothetical protein
MPPEMEHRFLLDRAALARVLGAAGDRLEEVIYQPDRPVAWARTTYLDTADERYLRSSGRSSRLRVRLRQYAAAADPDRPALAMPGTWLEIKRSAGLHRRKLRIRMSAGEIAGVLRGGLVPQVTTWYRRRSFAGAGVRLTVDQDITFCPPSLPVAAGEPAEPDGLLAREARAVLEVKSASGDPLPEWLFAALAALPLDAGYSKLRAAVAARDGERDPRAAAGQVLGPRPSAVRESDPSDQAEAQAEGTVTALSPAVEGLEGAGEVHVREAGAAVVDLEHHRRLVGADGDPNGTAGVALGVVDEVGERAREQRGITRQ